MFWATCSMYRNLSQLICIRPATALSCSAHLTQRPPMRRNEVDEEFRAQQVAAARQARAIAAAALRCSADQGPACERLAARADAAGRAPQDVGPLPLPAHVAREVLRALVEPEVPCPYSMPPAEKPANDAFSARAQIAP